MRNFIREIYSNWEKRDGRVFPIESFDITAVSNKRGNQLAFPIIIVVIVCAIFAII